MKKFTLECISTVIETISLIGLIFGNTYIRIACGFLNIGYKLAKAKYEYEKTQNTPSQKK